LRYAKLINNYPSYAPRRIRIGSVIVYNPTDAQLLSEGYLPVIETQMPETDERHYAEPHWQEEPNRIVQRWEVKEIPITDEEALTRYANTLTDANDPDLISAAETLITERIKEDS
jgi:hypothetical protein